MPPPCTPCANKQRRASAARYSCGGAFGPCSASPRTPRSYPLFNSVRDRKRQPGVADLLGRAEVIVRHAMEGDPLLLRVELRIGRGRIVVAGLSRRADDREPAAVAPDGNRSGGHGMKKAGLPESAAEIELLIVHVTAEGECGLRSVDAPLSSGRTVDVVPALGRS